MRRSAKTSSKQRLAGATLLAALLCSCMMVLAQTPAHAAVRESLGPSFTITSPLYNGIASGPVGTNVTVLATAGSGWTPNASIVLSVSLESVGCSANTSAATPTPPPNATPGPEPIPVSIPPVTVAGDSSFSATFPWPTTAGQTNTSSTYVVCANETGAGTQVGRTTNVFNVLSNNAPTVEVSPTTAHAGDAVLVTGTNWLPLGQTITLYLQGANLTFKQDSGAPLQTTSPLVPDSQGNFQVTVHLPTNRVGSPAQNNAQNVVAVMGVQLPDGTFPLEAKSQAMTITEQAATPTPQPTIMPTASTTTGGTTTPSSKSTENLLLGLLGLIAVVLLIAGIVVAVLALRGRSAPDAPGGSRRNSGGYGGGYGPAGSMDATMADGEYGGYEEDSPWQQPGRPWSGNRQGMPYDQPPRRSRALDDDDDRYRTRMGDPYQSSGSQRPATPPPSRPPTPPPSRPTPQRPPVDPDDQQDTGPLWPPPAR
jgi:hypothetical protein